LYANETPHSGAFPAKSPGPEIWVTAWWARELSHIKQSQLVIKGAGK